MSSITSLFKLTNRESLVLNSCLGKGLAEITRETNLPRSTVEYILKKLLFAKLIKTTLIGKRLIYTSLPKQEIIREALSDTSGSHHVYSGVSQILHIWEEIADLPKNTKVIALQPYPSFAELVKKVDPVRVEEINKKMTAKNFIFEAVIHEDNTKTFFQTHPVKLANKVALSFSDRLEDMVKANPDFMNAKSEMFIVNSRLIFIDWYKETAIEINNKNMVELAKMMFTSIKKYGQRFNQGDFIKKVVGFNGPTTN